MEPGVELAEQIPAGFDTGTLLGYLSGDVALAWKLIGLFQKNSMADSRRLKDLIVQGDVQGVIETSHRLKGAAIYVSADRVRDIAGELEEIARDGNLDRASQVLQVLERELARCRTKVP